LGVRSGVGDADCVEGGGGVECFLRGPDGRAGEQDGVFVAAGGAGVDGEAEGVGGAAVAQAEQGLWLVVSGQRGGDVGEAAAAGDLELAQLGPVLFRVEQDPQGDRAAG
jgi:hypothetical protein